MDSGDKIIKELLDAIDNSVNQFQDNIPLVQKQILDEVISLSKEFYIPAKTVKQQAYNLKLLSKLKGKINNIILTKDYENSLKDYIKGFDVVSKIQSTYFSTVFSETINKSALLDQLKKTAIELTIEKLSSNGLVEAISSNISSIINRSITTGMSYNDMLAEVNKLLIDTEESEGILTRYTKQITNDSLSVFSRQYTKAITEDLNLVWYKYVGSLLKKSRPFCVALIKAKEDCLPYIHQSQLEEISKGHICGKDVSLQGLYPNTDGSNLQINAGGYNCGHQLIPVSEAVVPKELRDKFS